MALKKGKQLYIYVQIQGCLDSTLKFHANVEGLPCVRSDNAEVDKRLCGDEINLKKLEEDLEVFAARHKLTTRNVKSLLHVSVTKLTVRNCRVYFVIILANL